MRGTDVTGYRLWRYGRSLRLPWISCVDVNYQPQCPHGREISLVGHPAGRKDRMAKETGRMTWPWQSDVAINSWGSPGACGGTLLASCFKKKDMNFRTQAPRTAKGYFSLVIYFSFIFSFLFRQLSIYNPGWPGTHCVTICPSLASNPWQSFCLSLLNVWIPGMWQPHWLVLMAVLEDHSSRA